MRGRSWSSSCRTPSVSASAWRSSPSASCGSTSGSCTPSHDALDFVDDFGSRWLGVVLELNTAWSERALYANIRQRRDRIAIVQVSDFAVGTMAASERVVIGDGDIPLRRICQALAAAGYDGW